MMDTSVHRHRYSGDACKEPLRVAVIGSGPAGFFCTDYLLRLAQPCVVHMYERWPVPYGSARHAIAPDRQRIRAVTAAFDRIASRQGFHFFGNVTVGKDISLQLLQHHYHAVILATGADDGLLLNIPGEETPGFFHITKFAGWYNGRPDCAFLRPDLTHTAAAVIGAGNAALDAVRILSLPSDWLPKTDIPEPMQQALASSAIREIHLIIRRGPLDVRFSLSEFGALFDIPGVSYHLHPENCLENIQAVSPEEEQLLSLYKSAHTTPKTARHIHFHFYSTPKEIQGKEAVSALVVKSGEEDTAIPCYLIISAIGQGATEIDGIALNAQKSMIPHKAGRVTQQGIIVPGLYTAGWAKRSGTGMVGKNKPDCRETVQAIMDDRDSLQCKIEAVPDLPKDAVTLDGWHRIDAAERGRAENTTKTRECFLTVEEMLQAAGIKNKLPSL